MFSFMDGFFTYGTAEIDLQSCLCVWSFAFVTMLGVDIILILQYLSTQTVENCVRAQCWL
jgi:hypothetical protein